MRTLCLFSAETSVLSYHSFNAPHFPRAARAVIVSSRRHKAALRASDRRQRQSAQLHHALEIRDELRAARTRDALPDLHPQELWPVRSWGGAERTHRQSAESRRAIHLSPGKFAPNDFAYLLLL